MAALEPPVDEGAARDGSGPLPGDDQAAADGYDLRVVALAARARDPGLPVETAEMLARRAWPLLQEVGGLDAPALARRLMAEAGVGATPANVVATAAVRHCQERGLLP